MTDEYYDQRKIDSNNQFQPTNNKAVRPNEHVHAKNPGTAASPTPSSKAKTNQRP